MSEEAIPIITEKELIDTPKKKGNNRTLQIILGWLFTLPAIVLLIITYIVPTFKTLILAFQNQRGGREATFVGMENFERLFSSQTYGSSWGFSLLELVIRLSAVILPPLVIALGVGSFKIRGRKFFRVIASIPLAIYTPIPLAIGWAILINPAVGFLPLFNLLRDPATTRLVLLVIDWFTYFGLACGFGATVYLSALVGGYHSEDKKRVTKAMIILGVVLILMVTALSLQSFANPYILSGGGPNGLTTNLALLYFKNSMMQLQFGLASATILPVLLITQIAGLISILLVILSRSRLVLSNRAKEPLVNKVRWLWIVLLVLSLLTLFFALLPNALILSNKIKVFIEANEPGKVMLNIPTAKLMLNTWGPSLIAVLLIQIPVALLAAFGIGALRPMGKGSDWLLLLFGSWIFFTPILLAVPNLMSARDLDLINTMGGILLPYRLNIPMILVLTLLFKGQREKWEDSEDKKPFLSVTLLPALPMVALLGVVSLIFMQQELVWSLVINTKADLLSLPMALLREGSATLGFQASKLTVSATIIRSISGLVLFLLALVFQIFYLDRIAFKTGKK